MILVEVCTKKKGSFVQRIPKVVSYKYANGVISYMMIYVQAAILRPLQKVISHKYANGVIIYMMIYVQAAILGQLRKKEKFEKMFNPQRGDFFRAPLPPLYDVLATSKDVEIGGTPMAREEL